MKRLHIIYSGRVQGVGFRYTAERIAVDLKLGGWVRNNPDGSAEIVCEGEEDNLKEFSERIEDAFSGYIREKDINWLEATGEFKHFGIKF